MSQNRYSEPIPPLTIALESKPIDFLPLSIRPNSALVPLGDATTEWYLGIHLGATALIAVLLNSKTRQQISLGVWPWGSSSRAASVAFADAAFTCSPDANSSELLPADDTHSYNQLLTYSQQYFSMGVPYYCAQAQAWLPAIQWSRLQSFSLHQIQQKVTGILMGLRSSGLPSLAGVVVNRCVGSSESYDFNLREAVLAAGLVKHPEQIYFVEGAIAALLETATPTDAHSDSLIQRGTITNLREGKTLLLFVGAVETEWLLVNLPVDCSTLQRSDCHMRGFAYGTNDLDQDIVAQLLYPRLRQTKQIARLNCPLPGQPDSVGRVAFEQQLHDLPEGITLWRLAGQVRETLCREATAQVQFEQWQWQLSEAEFSQQILSPFIQGLNRECNTLLSQTGTDAAAIRQVICVGAIAQTATIRCWLKQKLPNTKIVACAELLTEGLLASGLAKIPLYPQLIDTTRHQYSMLFLLQELLNALPSTPLRLGQILQRLERRGIHTNACQKTILNLLDGELPAMLGSSDNAWLSPSSRNPAIAQTLASTPLFKKQDHHYVVNGLAKVAIKQHLETLLTTTIQTLQEPLPFGLTNAQSSLLPPPLIEPSRSPSFQPIYQLNQP